jgi:hypothetical protein
MGTYKIVEVLLRIGRFQICKLLWHQLLPSCSARLLFFFGIRDHLLVAGQLERGNQLLR